MVWVLMAGCRARRTDLLSLPAQAPDARVAYGADPFQFGELRLPPGGGPHPVAVVIHGGFWRAAYSLDHIGHLCEALRAEGVATWSLEYRRIGNSGGGWPGTLEDVAAGVEYLREMGPKHRLDLGRVVVVGHSAGGQLALWVAGRGGVQGVVSLAGVADLRRAWDLKAKRARKFSRGAHRPRRLCLVKNCRMVA